MKSSEDIMASGEPLTLTVDVAGLPGSGRAIRLEANEAQCIWLAREMAIEAVRRFEAEMDIKPWRKGGARVTGSLAADIVQECGVSLEPFDTTVKETFDVCFLPDTSRAKRKARDEVAVIDIDPDAPDEPEMLDGRTLDAAAVAIEHFALGLDLFPRKPGVELDFSPDEESGDGKAGKRPSPFAVLKGPQGKNR